MKLAVDAEIFTRFSDLELGVIAVRGIDNRGQDREIEAFLRHALLEAGLLIKLKPIQKDPTILFYRKLLADMGAPDATPSMEKLLLEFSANLNCEAESSFAPGQTAGLIGVTALTRKNPLSDLTRGAEIQFRLPIFSFDMGQNDALFIREATKEDQETAQEYPLALLEKEPILSIGGRVAVRHLFCERGKAAAVSAATRDALIVIPCFSVNRRRAMSARNEIARRAKDSFGRDTETGWISSAAPEFLSNI